MATVNLSSRSVFGGSFGRGRTGPRASFHRGRRRSRPMVEDLEGRQVLSAIGLDPTYGFGGVTLQNIPQNTAATTFTTSITSIANQSGKVVEVGTLDAYTSGTSTHTYRLFVSRFNTDGSIDGTFGSGGTQVISIASGGVTYDVHADDIAVQSDGKIDVLGTANSTAPNATDFVVARLTSNGLLDTTFGTSGFRLIDFSMVTGAPVPFSNASALAIDPSGKIVAVGSTTTATIVRDFAIARLNVDGSFDTSFNTSGMAAVPFGAGNPGDLNFASASSVVVQPDSKIVAAGLVGTGGMGAASQAAVVRLNTNGTLDTSFNGTGKLTYKYNLGGDSSDTAGAVALQGAQIVIAGSSHFNEPPGSPLNIQELTVTRLNANGTFDASFNGGGKFILPLTLGGIDFNTGSSAVNVLSDGSILVGGTAYEKNTYGANYSGALVKLTSGGALDPGFGSAGVALLPMTLDGRMLIQPDGKVLFATYNGAARTTAPVPLAATTSILTTPNGKKATGLTITFNTGVNGTLATNIQVYQVKTVKGKKVVKIKKKGITYDAATQRLTINFAGKTAIGKGFQVVIAPGAIIGADGQVLNTNTITISPPSM